MNNFQNAQSAQKDMHASPSNSEKVCDVKLLCFVTKTVCMSK